MKSLSSRIFIVGSVLFFAISVASGKAVLSKLLIVGGKLPQPVEVTDPKLLKASNPWFGTFIPQWNQVSLQQIANPPPTAPRYELSFYTTFSSQDQIIYVAYYAFDPVSRRGFLYLPGSDEQWYSTNIRSIMRPHQDGRWNVADPAWSDQINSIIASGNEAQAPTAR